MTSWLQITLRAFREHYSSRQRMFVRVEAPWRALQSHFVNLKDIWEGALSQFIHCRVIQRPLPHQDSNKRKRPQKTLVLIRVAKSKLSSVEKPITQTRVCYTDSVQLWEFNAFDSSAIPKPVKKKNHSSDLLINLCRCGKSACNRDWWNFSPWFLLGARKRTNRPLRTSLMKFRTLGNACRPPHAEMVSVTGRERHCGARCKRYFTKLDTISSLFTHPQQRLDLKFKKRKEKRLQQASE